ncbi:hypothetical protein ABW20_dc0105474 [Dactylellina cionopaga]|nr:hypothetical protein ABW20_dc0105474 [Dactylellina cionopaga]
MESTEYQDFYWDTRWRPYTCPRIFPFAACVLQSHRVTKSCLQNTICSYARDVLPTGPMNGTDYLKNITKPVKYIPRALYYRADQNTDFDTKLNKQVAPRYRLTSVHKRAFSIYSITFAWASQYWDDETISERAQSIVIRGYSNVTDRSDPQNVVVINIPQAPIFPTKWGGWDKWKSDTLSYTDSALPQTPTLTEFGTRQTMLPAPKTRGVIPGIADPYQYMHYEFPKDEGITQWANLVALEISAYRVKVDINETAPPEMKGKMTIGSFYLKEMNITTSNISGGCATKEEVR